MISKKTKKKKGQIKKGESKFISDEKAVSRPKDKLAKNIKTRRELKEEARYQEEQRKKQVNKLPLKVSSLKTALPCKNEGCRKSRRHGSAYCGQC